MPEDWKPTPELERAVDELLKRSAETFMEKLRLVTAEVDAEFMDSSEDES